MIRSHHQVAIYFHIHLSVMSLTSNTFTAHDTFVLLILQTVPNKGEKASLSKQHILKVFLHKTVFAQES